MAPWILPLLGSVVSGAASGAAQNAAQQQPAFVPAPAQRDDSALYLAGGLALVVIVGLVIVLVLAKQK